MKTRLISLTAIVAMAILFGATETPWASSSYQRAFNTKYSFANARLKTCTVCHTNAPAVNRYGAAIRARLNKGRTIVQSLTAVQRIDSDKDTFTNIREIRAGTFPGNPNSKPAAAPVAAASAAADPAAAAPVGIQARATAVNTYAQDEYLHLAFDQVDPENYRYVDVKADRVVIGQTSGYTDDDGEEAGGLETTVPLDVWSTIQVEVTDTSTVNIYVDGSSEPFTTYDF